MTKLSPDRLREFFDFMTGDKIGAGMSRTVFAHPCDPAKVIKVENVAHRFQNIKEWEFWQDFSFCNDVSKWLAPCHGISTCGTFLIQSRAHDLRPEEIPEKLPAFLTDHKPENFGKIGNRIVCRDYGYLRLTATTRLRRWTAK